MNDNVNKYEERYQFMYLSVEIFLGYVDSAFEID
jgi:hypothetical protein